jgi:hypothetical protein
MRRFTLPSLFGLKITVSMSAIITFFVLWLVLVIVGVALLRFSLVESIIGGFIGALLHYIGEFLHQIGHSIAARRTGHPMSGMYFWGLLAASLYPKDERELPGSVHIRRALGGPIMSSLVTLISGAVLALMDNNGSLAWWLVLFFFLDNLLVFALGAFVPIRMGTFVTDGGTILYWRTRS